MSHLNSLLLSAVSVFFQAIFISSITLFSVVNAYSQNITPAQIETFKKLPRAQQEMLAKQYGVDLSVLQQTPLPIKQKHTRQA